MHRIGYLAPSVIGGALMSAIVLCAGSAPALDFNGTTLPIVPDTHEDCSSDVWFCVNDHEDTLGYTGEDIDVVETATIDQETFNPLCNLSFEVLFKGASYINVFGWYEAKRDASGDPVKPDPSEMHVMLGCDAPVGETVNLPAPDGVTEIGFFLANNKSDSCVVNDDSTLKDTQENLFFSEPSLNDDDGRVHLLVWQSRADPTAFYFGWEDQHGGGDNDFEDLLTFVTGIQCAGGGELCDTGDDGICAQGVEQCRDGQLTCVPLQEPHDEECNAVDDDCDGEIDDGDDLCEAGMVCYQGTCQPRCGGGEFQCVPPLVCANDVCIDAKCVNKECGDGEVCRAGECVGACDDVVCPYGQACRVGVCVDVCEGVQCDEGFACEVQYPDGMDGEPVGLCSSCGCSGCADGFSCEKNLCVEDACADMSCAEGFRCEAGTCIDKCQDATCPTGMKCATGSCVIDEDYDPMGAGGEGGGSNSSHSTTGFSIGSGATSSTSIGSTTSPSGQGGTSGPLETQSSAADDGGCGCRVAASRSIPSPWWFSLPLALGFVRRRGRKIRKPRRCAQE